MISLASNERRTITALRPPPGSAVETLRRALHRSDGLAAAAAAMHLAALGPRSAAALPELTAALGNGGGPVVHWAAAHALGRIGGAAWSAIPALEASLDSPSGDVRAEAAEALRRIRGRNLRPA